MPISSGLMKPFSTSFSLISSRDFRPKFRSDSSSSSPLLKKLADSLDLIGLEAVECAHREVELLDGRVHQAVLAAGGAPVLGLLSPRSKPEADPNSARCCVNNDAAWLTASSGDIVPSVKTSMRSRT